MAKRKKIFLKIFSILAILAILTAGGIFYLNKAVLPVKLKSLIIQTIETATGKKAGLEKVEFSLFKGIVLSGLELYDGSQKLIGIKEASCSFLILPILKEKKIIIPSIKITEPYVYLERRQDNTLNLLDLIPKEPSPGEKQQFSFIVSGIRVLNGRIDFLDNAVSPAFSKGLDEIYLNLSLALPASLRFNFKAKTGATDKAEISAEGEFKILDKSLNAGIALKNLSPGEFSSYYNQFGLSIPDGKIDSSADLNLKDKTLKAKVSLQSRQIQLFQEKIGLKLNAQINADIEYNMESKELNYSGASDIINSNVQGIENIGEIKAINAKLAFNPQGVNAEWITASVLGFNIESKAVLSDFSRPWLSLEAKSSFSLAAVQDTLLNKFKISLPAKIDGQAQASINLKTSLPPQVMPQFDGNINIISGTAALPEYELDIKEINGKVQFNQDQASWEGLNFNCLDTGYSLGGSLADFKSPALNLTLSSQDINLPAIQKILNAKFKLNYPIEVKNGTGRLNLSLKTTLPLKPQELPKITGTLGLNSAGLKIAGITPDIEEISGNIAFQITGPKSQTASLDLKAPELSLKSDINIDASQIQISKLDAKYKNSRVFLQGSLDAGQASLIEANLQAQANLNLKDLDNPFLSQFQGQIKQINPQGELTAKVNLKGALNGLKKSDIQADIKGPDLSAYGLKFEDLSLNYNQSNGLADISLRQLSFYDGTIKANARLNLDSENMPFWLEAALEGIKLEKLKNDTPIKKQDISGTLQAITKLNGFISGFEKLSGSGKVLINQGRLWQLNLFKGMGELLFTKDFANVVFDEAYCEFFVKDKLIFSDNILLKSNLVNLSGNAKIGFDSSLEASINVEMGDEFAPETGTFKDITTALVGQAGKFATITLSGTLQKPAYKFQPAVANVLKGIKDTILGSIFGK